MPTVAFKFKTREEQGAFATLMSFIPKRQRWDDIEYYTPTQCHVCDKKGAVKSGIVSCNSFFEPEIKDCYTFWCLCQSCHKKGWQIPLSVSKRRGIEYYLPIYDLPDKINIKDFEIFKFPQIVLLNTDTVLMEV